MRMRAPSYAVPDPLLAPVRRRHPDVDLVVLPGEGPPAAATVTPGEATAALAAVAQRLADLWGAAADGSPESPVARFRYGADPGSLRATARVVAVRDDGEAVLGRLRRDLEHGGWAVRTDRTPEKSTHSDTDTDTDTDTGPRLTRLTAALDDLDLVASWAAPSGALVLTLTAATLAVGPAEADRLTRPGGVDEGAA